MKSHLYSNHVYSNHVFTSPGCVCSFASVYELLSTTAAACGPEILRPISLLTWIAGGFDSSTILILRGWILMSLGNFPESLTQAMLVGCNVSREIGCRVMIILLYIMTTLTNSEGRIINYTNEFIETMSTAFCSLCSLRSCSGPDSGRNGRECIHIYIYIEREREI